MTKTEIKAIKDKYNGLKERNTAANFREELQASKNCFASFSGDNVIFYKVKNKQWNKKIVSDWRGLTADEFIDKASAIDWEAL